MAATLGYENATFSLSLDIPEKCLVFTLLEIFWRLRLKMSAFVLFHQHIVFDHQKPGTGPDPVPIYIGNCLLELKKVLHV